MSLERVVEDVRSEAEAKAEEIRAEAEAEAEEIRNEAEAEAEEIRSEAEAAVEREIEREREQAISSAKLDAKQDRLETRRDALGEVRSAAEERIAAIEGDRRAELTRALIEAGLTEFDDTDDVTIRGRPADADLLAELADDFDCSHAGDHDCLGGVVLASDASRVRVDNTFDAVLDRVWDDELQAVSDRLFGE